MIDKPDFSPYSHNIDSHRAIDHDKVSNEILKFINY